MSGQLLTTSASLQCPHGGSVIIASANVRVNADGSALALVTDSFTVSGCPFQIPFGVGTKPSPCVRVQWIVTNLRTLVDGTPTLSTASVGLCLSPEQVPQGPVSVVTAQTRASGQ